MKRFTGHKEPWGTFVDVKENAPERLETLLKRKKKWDFTVLLSSVTDAYQPVEKKYRITRQVLEILNKHHNYYLDILTRSSLILRDLKLLSSINKRSGVKITVGMSISMIDDHWRRIIEPHASSIEKRFDSLQKIHDEGISTYLFFGPFIPGISSWEVLENIKDSVDRVTFDRLNPRGGIDRLLLNLMRERGTIPREYKKWIEANTGERRDLLEEITNGFLSKINELGIKNFKIVYKTEWDKKRPI
jgi:DNA repair photolyase